jgi:hypothetical protein
MDRMSNLINNLTLIAQTAALIEGEIDNVKEANQIVTKEAKTVENELKK